MERNNHQKTKNLGLLKKSIIMNITTAKGIWKLLYKNAQKANSDYEFEIINKHKDFDGISQIAHAHPIVQRLKRRPVSAHPWAPPWKGLGRA